MTRKIFLLGLYLIPFLSHAQVTINAPLPPAGLVQKDQLWNLILINNKDELLNVSVKMNLKDAATGEVLMSGNTNNIMIGKGVKILKIDDVQPVLYNYNSPDFTKNYLPMGSYIICYEVYQNIQESPAALGEECSSINIDPLSPPLLNMPADESEIETPYPQFSWMPPTPYDIFSNLRYDLIVTEILKGQSATEAIGYNMPVYMKSNILQTNEMYPSTFSKLDTGKVYAWQVTAVNGLSYAAKTEVWTFTIGKKIEPAITTANNNYLLLDNDLKDTYIITSKQIHIKYRSFDKEHNTPIIFSDAKGKEVAIIDKRIAQGDNYFDISLDNHFQKGVIYNLIITDLKGNRHLLRFSIK